MASMLKLAKITRNKIGVDAIRIYKAENVMFGSKFERMSKIHDF